MQTKTIRKNADSFSGNKDAKDKLRKIHKMERTNRLRGRQTASAQKKDNHNQKAVQPKSTGKKDARPNRHANKRAKVARFFSVPHIDNVDKKPTAGMRCTITLIVK